MMNRNGTLKADTIRAIERMDSHDLYTLLFEISIRRPNDAIGEYASELAAAMRWLLNRTDCRNLGIPNTTNGQWRGGNRCIPENESFTIQDPMG